MSKKARLAVAVLAGLGWIGAAQAQDAPAEAAPPDKPLTGMLKKSGIDTGELTLSGFVDAGYTYGASNPPDDFITGRVFDTDANELLLNQLDLSIEKTVDAAAVAKDGRFAVGGKVEVMYGSDARFIHSNGMNFYGTGVVTSPENQFDLTQAYIDVGLPVGNGLLLRGGKFVTLLGYETINPTTDPLYSHSYLFGFAIPFTNTGVLAFYNLSDSVSVAGGFSRGWDQSLEDNNQSLDYLGQIKWVANDKVTAYLTVITGPEQDDDNSDYTTVFDGIVTYAASDKLSFAINGDYGWAAGASSDGGTAAWYGVAGYSGYKLCTSTTLNGRVEWFNDDDGARGIGTTVYEATVGLGIRPFPKSNLGSNLLVRPEVRFDYADDPIYDGGTDDYQFTAAIDAIFTF